MNSEDDLAERIDRRLGRLAFVGQAAAAIAAVAKLAWGASASYISPWPWLFAALLGGISLWTLADVLAGRSTRVSTTAYVIAAQAVLVAHAWVWDPAKALGMPALDNAAAVGVGLAFLVLPRKAALVNVTVTQVMYVLLLPRALGATWTGWIVVTTVTAALLCLVARIAIDESVDQMLRSRQMSAEAEGLEVQTSVRAQALSGWLDIVHREIIGTLLPASREMGTNSELVRARAASALTRLSAFRLPESEEGFARFVEKTGDALGLRVDLQQHGEWSDEGPQVALRSSVTEALSNIQRHAGTSSATITARFASMDWAVTVVDRGSGFDPESVPAARAHGLSISLRSPWEAAGGRATISSSPGQGTMISLTWASPLSKATTWSRRSLRWLSALVVLSLSFHLAMGWLAGGFHSPVAMALGEAAILLATVLAFVAPRWDGLSLVLLFASQVVLAANVAPSLDADLRTWFAGAITGAVGVMAFRGRWRSSLVMIVTSWIVAAWLMAGQAFEPLILGRLLGSYVGPLLGLVFAYVGEILRRVDRTHQAQLSRRTAIQRRAAEVRAGLERWDTENAPLIDFVTPMLSSLAAGELSGPDRPRDCRALEACCRDYIRSPGFMDRDLLHVAYAARRRGTDVVIDVAATPADAMVTALRRASCDVLEDVGTTSLNLTKIDGGPTTFLVKGDANALPGLAALIHRRLSGAGIPCRETRLSNAVLIETQPDGVPESLTTG